ncbi:cutinase family protein [Gordonia sp. (in: high G+C Gram-positive bacteria)]|uniref:cutinase family protein n=1 Tax=Gordonia sp. (in: high G+C Gram-positive bacteria) TaxID=84139 RepID=UPI0039E4AF7B
METTAHPVEPMADNASKAPSRWSGATRATAVAAIAAAVALCASFLSTPPAHAACAANGAVIFVPGTGDTSGSAYAGLVAKAKEEGKDVIQVQYPTTLWPTGPMGYDHDADLGRQATINAISDYQSQCKSEDGTMPNIEVTGYSQGARVAGDVLSDIGNGRLPGISKENITGTLFSDPRQERISGFAGRGIEMTLFGVIPGLTMSGRRDGGFGDIPVNTLCEQGDPICYLADPVKDPLGAIDGLLGYFVKHTDYPQFGWINSLKPEDWENINGGGHVVCHEAPNNGGNVCVLQDVSSVTRLIRIAATALGMSAEDVAAIPDIYGKVQERLNLNGVLPGVGISDLQPLFKLVYGLLPQLPYLTYHSGGYLPDVFTVANLVSGIIPALTGNPGPLFANAELVARSIASIIAIPVNASIYWGNQLGGVFGHPNLMGGQLGIGFIPGDEVWPNTWLNHGPPATPGTESATTTLAAAPAQLSAATLTTLVHNADQALEATPGVDAAKSATGTLATTSKNADGGLADFPAADARRAPAPTVTTPPVEPAPNPAPTPAPSPTATPAPSPAPVTPPVVESPTPPVQQPIPAQPITPPAPGQQAPQQQTGPQLQPQAGTLSQQPDAPATDSTGGTAGGTTGTTPGAGAGGPAAGATAGGGAAG